jgi:hypothetical protein
MIKLPAQFRAHDKELHTAFYFCAAAFFNILFGNKHVLIFIVLLCFGIGMEHFQEYSNTFTHTKIHGRFDIEDVQANVKGLMLFSIVAFCWFCLKWCYKKLV